MKYRKVINDKKDIERQIWVSMILAIGSGIFTVILAVTQNMMAVVSAMVAINSFIDVRYWDTKKWRFDK